MKSERPGASTTVVQVNQVNAPAHNSVAAINDVSDRSFKLFNLLIST